MAETFTKMASHGASKKTPLSLSQLFNSSLEVVLQQGGSHPKKLVVVKSTDKISKAFKLIRKHDVTALPVYDRESDQYTSFVEILDIVLFVMQAVHRGVAVGTKIQAGDVNELLADPKFKTHKCSELAGIAGDSSFIPIDSSVNLQAAIEEMLLSDLQRLVVLNPKHELMGILSRSRIVHILTPAILQTTWVSNPLSSFQSLFRQVPSITHDKTVFEAFKEIYKSRNRSLAVMDESGRLQGHISSSDIKNIDNSQQDIFSVLDYPLKNFCEDITSKKFKKIYPKLSYPVTFRSGDKIGDVLALMLKTRLHQFYITDNAKTLLGSIHHLDILQLVAQNS